MRVTRYLVIVFLLITNISCDQLTKKVARQNLEYGENVVVLKDYIWFIKVENTGAFLSAFSDFPQVIRIILLTGMPLALLIGFTWYLFTKTKLTNLTVVALSFIVGGGFGNMIDRLLYGSVTDFVYMDFIIFHTGIFNMADVSIMVGLFILLIATATRKKLEESSAGG